MITINIDASSLRHLHCFRKFYNVVVRNVSTMPRPLNDIEIGSAWHVFRETLALTRNPMKACGAAQKYFASKRAEGMIFKEKKEYLNEDYLQALCLRYLNLFGVEKSFGKWDVLTHPVTNTPMVEQTFSIPFYKDNYIEVFLQGTMDEFVKYPAGFICLGDDKTTSSWDKDGYLMPYALKPQLIFYVLALILLSEQEGGDWYKELISMRVGARINAIFLKSKIEEVVFEQSRVFFFDSEVIELRTQLQCLCWRLSNQVQAHSLPPREGMINDTCQEKYNSLCPFFHACASPREEVYEKMLNNMPSKPYTPLDFRKHNT